MSIKTLLLGLLCLFITGCSEAREDKWIRVNVELGRLETQKEILGFEIEHFLHPDGVEVFEPVFDPSNPSFGDIDLDMDLDVGDLFGETAADSGRPGTRPGGLGQNRRPSLTDRFLQKFDNNNNGMIEPSELPKQENSKIMRADTNSDGRLTRIELQNSDPRDLLSALQYDTGESANNLEREEKAKKLKALEREEKAKKLKALEKEKYEKRKADWEKRKTDPIYKALESEMDDLDAQINEVKITIMAIERT